MKIYDIKKEYYDKDSVMKKDISSYSNIPNDQLVKAMKLSSSAFKLLIYYFSKSGSWKFNDTTIIKECNLTERSMKDARRELINNDWLIIDKSGIIDIYILGLDIVDQYKGKYKRNKHNREVYDKALS